MIILKKQEKSVVPCVVIPPFLEMDPSEHYRGIIRAWNETKRIKPIIPLIFFSQNFGALISYAKEEKAPIFFKPHEAAFSAKIIIKRMKFLSKIYRYLKNIVNFILNHIFLVQIALLL